MRTYSRNKKGSDMHVAQRILCGDSNQLGEAKAVDECVDFFTLLTHGTFVGRIACIVAKVIGVE